MEQFPVVDENGKYVTFVMVESNGNVIGYDLKKGEKVVNAAPPFEIAKPVFKNNQWVETATPEEIEKELYPNGRPKPIPPQKTAAELEKELVATQLVAAENFEKTLLLQDQMSETRQSVDVANAAIVDLYESML